MIGSLWHWFTSQFRGPQHEHPPPALVPIVSSNVEGAGFDHATDELVVRYLSGEFWAYKVGPLMAADFFQAASKGTWLWDNVRVRGTKHLHRVPARQLTWRG